MLKQLLKLAVITALAIVAQKYMNGVAFAERGYCAVGGEIFTFPTVLVAGYYLTGIHSWAARQARKHERQEERWHEARRRVSGGRYTKQG